MSPIRTLWTSISRSLRLPMAVETWHRLWSIWYRAIASADVSLLMWNLCFIASTARVGRIEANAYCLKDFNLQPNPFVQIVHHPTDRIQNMLFSPCILRMWMHRNDIQRPVHRTLCTFDSFWAVEGEMKKKKKMNISYVMINTYPTTVEESQTTDNSQ